MKNSPLLSGNHITKGKILAHARDGIPQPREGPADNKMLTYQEFLETDFWKAIRLRAIARSGAACSACRSPNRIEVHHLFYPDGPFSVTLDHLLALCGDCHEEAHKWKLGGIAYREEFVEPKRRELLAYLRTIRGPTYLETKASLQRVQEVVDRRLGFVPHNDSGISHRGEPKVQLLNQSNHRHRQRLLRVQRNAVSSSTELKSYSARPWD